jgi:hypothetical protein
VLVASEAIRDQVVDLEAATLTDLLEKMPPHQNL